MKDMAEQIYDELNAQVVRLLQHSLNQASRIAELECKVEKLARMEAAERLRADQGWQRYESANADRNALRANMVAAPSAPAVEQDKVICANLGELLLTQAQRKAADTDKVREVAAWMTEDGERVVTKRTMEGAKRDGGAMLSSMAPYSVALVRAATMAAQAPVREVPEGWQLVPKTITPDMMREINLTGSFTDAALQVRYTAMLAAAPLPAAPVQQEGASNG